MNYFKRILLPLALTALGLSDLAFGGHGHVDNVATTILREVTISESMTGLQPSLNIETGSDYKFKSDWENGVMAVEVEKVFFEQILNKASIAD